MYRSFKSIIGILAIILMCLSTVAYAVQFPDDAAITMNNTDGPDQGITIIGNWTNSTWQGGGQYLGSNYIHDGNSGKGEKSIVFSPVLTAGDYAVFIRYTSSSNRAGNVPVDIVHEGTTDSHIINQKHGGGQWHTGKLACSLHIYRQ